MVAQLDNRVIFYKVKPVQNFAMTMTIAKTQLKEEIDPLDDRYLEWVYQILRQFPHLSDTTSPPMITEPLPKPSLREVLSTLEEIEDEFPNVDDHWLWLDDIK